MAYAEIWIKTLHLAFMAVWVGTLFYLPRLLLSHSMHRKLSGMDSAAEGHMTRTEEFVFFYLATPAGVLTILFGIGLTVFGIEGGWLPVKLLFVALFALLHLYFGQIILAFRRGDVPHGRLFYETLTQVPWVLLVAIVYLAVAKPL